MIKKGLIIAPVILVLLIAFGILELVMIDKCLGDFEKRLKELDEAAVTETVATEDFDEVWKYWEKKRVSLELFLNHMDIIEIEMRMAECHGYITNGDCEGLHVQLTVLIELAEHVAHKCRPTIEHIL